MLRFKYTSTLLPSDVLLKFPKDLNESFHNDFILILRLGEFGLEIIIANLFSLSHSSNIGFESVI